MRTAFLALMLATADGSANAADAGFHAIALPHRRKGLSSRASIADAVAQSAARAGAAVRGAVRRAAVAIAGGLSGRADQTDAGRVSRRWWGCAAVLALVASPAAADVQAEKYQLVSANVAAADQQVFGGNYVFTQTCSAYGTVTMLVRGPDGATFMQVAAYTTADTTSGHAFGLGSGSVVRVTLAGTTACNASLLRVPG